MTSNIRFSPTVIRTERGLTISGTRITLYQVMALLKAAYPHDEITACFGLTSKQMTDIVRYIESHQDDVEAEYQQVLALAESSRRRPRKPEHAELWRELQEWKARLNSAEQ